MLINRLQASAQSQANSSAAPPPNTRRTCSIIWSDYFAITFRSEVGNLIWITLSTICQSNRLMTPIFETRWGRIPYQSARHSFEDCSSTLRKKSFLEHRLDAKMNHHFPQNNFDLLKLSWMSFYLHKGSNQIGQFPVINNFVYTSFNSCAVACRIRIPVSLLD